MISLFIACLAASLPLTAPQDFAQVAELTRNGEILRAFALATEIADPLQRAQARVHALWSGGDLVGALQCSEQALLHYPLDLYLLEQAAALALTLAEPIRAESYAARFEQALTGAALLNEERARIDERSAALSMEVGNLVQRGQSTRARLRRAQAVAIAGALSALVALLLISRPRQQKPQRAAQKIAAVEDLG